MTGYVLTRRSRRWIQPKGPLTRGGHREVHDLIRIDARRVTQVRYTQPRGLDLHAVLGAQRVGAAVLHRFCPRPVAMRFWASGVEE